MEDLKSLKKSPDSVAKNPNNHKIIIGIDYGTTFSGVSYVTTDKTGIEDITIMSPWPGDRHVSWKTPTRIAYSQENPKLKNNKWGFEVDASLISYSWTKLLLDKKAAAREHDDPSLTGMEGSGMLPLPPFRDAAGVCEDFLREVYTHVESKLRRQMTDLTFKNTPMQCWVTLPAVWSEEAKDATLRAAKNAGFGMREGDEIFTIAEPEAAAIATLKEYSKSGSMNQIKCNENILICDCGGGTIDITTYKIVQVQPYLTFDELCVGIGGKCGSTYIDRNLHLLLSKWFGSKFDAVPFVHKGPGSRFMGNFEALKRDFGGNDDKEDVWLGPITLEDVGSEHYEEYDRMVKLTYKDLQSLFDPVITEIIGLVKQQVKAAKDTQNAKINRLILVGGFGESPYLHQKLKTWCKRNGNITLICPLHPQSAVVRGAALRGLEGIAPRMKRLRRHYGISLSLPFREGTDPERDSFVDPWDNQKLCSGRMKWFIHKGENIIKDTFRTIFVALEYTPGLDIVLKNCLYASVTEQPPEYRSDSGVEIVGTIETTLSADNPDVAYFTKSIYNDELNRMVYEVHYQQQIIFGGKGDNLTFRCLMDDKEICKSVIKFDR